jgi:formylglycine-generating enzyme required for sulfatase activity
MKLLSGNLAKGFGIGGWHGLRLRWRMAGLLAGVGFVLASATAAEAPAFEQAKKELAGLNVPALCRAVEDLGASYPGKYRDGAAMLQPLREFEKELPALSKGLEDRDPGALDKFSQLVALREKALLSNPLLDFAQVLLVKRREDNLALPQNWQGNSSLNPQVRNEICLMPVQSPDRPLKTFYQPAKDYFVGDVDLNFDGDKLLFSSIGSHNRWQIFEIQMDGTGLRQVTPGEEPDVDNYDACYLPDNRIVFDSTSTFQGVPCVGGGDYVANLQLMNPDGTGIRRLCFDQDNDWCPVVLPSGRVMYLRWEYTDSAHYFSRVLMSMNPDGTGQTAVYKSNSYWPNSTFYARPLPGSPTKFVGIISGHHGVPRMGELVLFDTAKGRQEDTGAIQRIPGYGKPVKGIIKDELVNASWPKFLHPYPLSDKYFLVSCKPTEKSLWGIYLVDVFDNLLLLKEQPGWALFEPVPLRKTERPPVIQDKVKLTETNATVYVHDIYAGAGLLGVPRGTVKSLRVFQYEYSYRNQGGHYFVGMEGGWDVRRMIGTVPVEADGSAMFRIPANTPVALQPLDEEGKALQQMRSWLVGMPGEYVSCVGCHESQNSTAAPTQGIAARKAPVDPAPWYGPKRGFSFVREVQPVLDQYCAGCHNGQAGRPNLSDPKIIPTSGGISPLPQSYVALHPYVRRNGPEGDYHTLTPLEFHANTSLLVQMLRKGHHNVKLSAEAWDRLLTWIDINVPAYGTYHEVAAIPSNFEQRRYEAKKKYANVDEDIEAIPDPERKLVAFVTPEPEAPRPAPVAVPGWPIDPEKARQLQQALGNTEMNLDLGGGMSMPLKKVPAGDFVMGDVDGYGNEYPTAAARIENSFWIGAAEVSLAQYQQFDPHHRNGYYDMHYKDQVKPGYLMDHPDLPVIRVSWDQAMAFCQWLSARSGKKVLLPTEAQWEWACRAGSATPMFYGGLDTDFSAFANLADASLSKLAVSGVDPQPIRHPDKFWDFVPKEARFNDGTVHLAPVGQYQPNAWGLRNMIGNVAEWTRDDYRPYPYQSQAACAGMGEEVRKTVRGGSWADRPKESRASARWDYPQWQRVYNVGFRIVVVE